MVRRMYCIYDFKAEAPVSQVFQCFSNDDDASRMFRAVVLSPGSLVHEHPGDFGLLFVGTIDFDSLSFVANSGSRFNPVLTGDACVRAERARVESQSSKDVSAVGATTP